MIHDHDFVQEHSTTLGAHGARLDALESWTEKIEDKLSETATITKSTAQSVAALTKFGWILTVLASGGVVTAMINLIVKLAAK